MGTENGTNSFDAKILQRFFGDIRRLEEEMESKKGEYMAWCKRQRELINQHFDRAKDAGVPKRPLKALIKQQKLIAKVNAIVEELEDDDQEMFALIEDALGDFIKTPLGQAAKQREDDDETDVRPRHLKQREKDRTAEAAALDAAGGNGAERLHGLNKLN